MTTIIIPRVLLEQALEALELVTEDYDDSAVGLEINAIQALRAELAAPASKPLFAELIAQHEGLAEELAAMDAPPAWHDAPTCAGLWMCLYRGEISTAIFNDYEIENFDAEQMGECRWYGPIPHDGEKS